MATASVLTVSAQEVSIWYDAPQPSVANFYATFGTKGCSLVCKERQSYQQKKHQIKRGQGVSRTVNYRARRDVWRASDAAADKYFSMDELDESARNGCGSCLVLKGILSVIFSPDLSIDRQYSVSPEFFCSARNAEEPHEEKTVPLYHIKGMATLFEAFPVANILPGDTSANESMVSLKEWISRCISSHGLCGPGEPTPLPSRVVDVARLEKDGMEGIRLVETMSYDRGKYACLSHCWGSALIDCKTTKGTLEKSKSFINFHSLPKTFRDAIIVTRKLGLAYLWVDSLCIVQDDKQDWELESSRMADIYRNAHITIAATWATDSAKGCFSTSQPDMCLRIIHQKDSITTSYLIGARMSESEDFADHGQPRAPLLQRGWVFQERLLSHRLVHFRHNELSFQCLESLACECGNHGLFRLSPTKTIRHRQVEGRAGDKLSHRVLLARQTNQGSASIVWREMVTKYLALNLSKRTDIVPAISGCAQVFRDILRDEYVAGMWRKTLHVDLMWFNHSSVSPGRSERPATAVKHAVREWVAPSWSWASVEPGQGVRFNLFAAAKEIQLFLRGAITNVTCEPKGLHDMGELKAAHLTLRAALFPCYARRFCAPSSLEIHRRRALISIHQIPSRQPKGETTCRIAPEKQFDTRGGNLTCVWDARPGERLVLKAVPGCTYCLLGEIWLLRMAQVHVHGQEALDIFMILDKRPGQPNYERLGLLRFTKHSMAERKLWFEEVWAPRVLGEELITIL